MANISYDNPASLAPKIGFEPNGFLGGMWSGQRNADYTQAIQQSNLMKALGARQGMNELNDYEQNAPVRENERLAKIAGYQNDVKYKGDIMAGQAAAGRKTAAMITPEMENTLAQYRANNSQWKQQEIDRQAQAMNLFGESVGWSPDSNSPQLPGHDSLEGQMSRDQLLKKFKEQYPDLGLPDAWGPDTENKLFQRYQIARTLKNIKQKDELAKTELQQSTTLKAHEMDNATKLEQERIKERARLETERARTENLKTYTAKIISLESKRNQAQQPGSKVVFTPEDAAQLQSHKQQLLTEKAFSAVSVAIPTLVMQGKDVSEEAIAKVVKGIVAGMSPDAPAASAAEEKWNADWSKVPPGGSMVGLDGKTYTKKKAQ